MKRFFLISALLLCGAFSASAQSTIYVCYSYPNKLFPVPIKINNQEVFTLYKNQQKKCVLYSEGKVIISIDTPAVIPYNSITYQWADEIQLTLSKNSVHYIKMEPKGNYLKFEELSEKDGQKEFSGKKYAPTPDYVEPHSDNPADSTAVQKGGKVPLRSKEPAAAPEPQTQE